MVRIIAMRIATGIPIFGNTCVNPESHQWTGKCESPRRWDSTPLLRGWRIWHRRQDCIENVLQKVVNSSVSYDSCYLS